MRRTREQRIREIVLTHKRHVFIAVSVAFLLLVLIRHSYFAVQDIQGAYDWHENIRGVLDELISVIIVTSVVSIALRWMQTPSDRIPPGYEILPKQISETVEEAAAEEVREWQYVGHTGEYTRNKIFDILKTHSSRKQSQTRVRLVILNPENDTLCERYAANKTRCGRLTSDGRSWTAEGVKAELLVTLIKTIRLHVAPNFLECQIGFRNSLSLYRFDRSDHSVIITQEDKQEPAFAYPAGSLFYDHATRENELIWEQSEEFDLSKLDERDVANQESLKDLLIKRFPSVKQETIELAFKISNRIVRSYVYH